MLVKPIPVAEMLFARTVQMELIVALVRKATRVILSEDVLVRIIICMTFPSLLPKDNNVTLLKLGGNLLQLLHQKKLPWNDGDYSAKENISRPGRIIVQDYQEAAARVLVTGLGPPVRYKDKLILR